MKKIYKSFKTIFVFLILSFGTNTINSQVTVQTYSYTGGVQTFVVPSCVSTLSVEVWGAEGGTGYFSTGLAGIGGKGGYAAGTLTVAAGNTLNIYVGGLGVNGNVNIGGIGGFNGGGLGGSYATLYSGGGGGGASDIRVGGNALTDRVIVGGGGGGGSSYVGTAIGGAGGGLTGGSGSGITTAKAGLGASQTAGGANGTDTQAGSAIGSPGVFGIGGNSGVAGCSGGGGGGWYGGGGGSGCNGGGGGGGSSYYGGAGVSNGVTTMGVRSGNGLITFTYTFNGSGVVLNASPASGTICSGSTATLTASNVLSYTWSPGGSNATSITVNPTSLSVYTVQGTNALGCISTKIFTVSVDAAPPTLTLANTANSGGICPNSTVALTASGATTYTWTGGSTTVTNGVVFSPTTPWTYTVNGSNACGTTSAMTSVSVHPPPTLTAVASAQTLCAGASLTLTALGNGSGPAWSGGIVPITNGVGFTPPASTISYSVISSSALSCTALATVPVTVFATPNLAPIASPTVICVGSSGTLTASGAANYTWSSPTSVVNTNTFLIPATTPVGSITYTITKSNSNCVDTKTIAVSVLSLTPVLAIVNPGTVCASTQATLFAGGGITYTWTAPGPPTFTFTGASPVVSPPVTSIYTVTAHDGTCVNTTTVQLVTKPNPTITITPSTPSVCAGGTVGLTANGGVNYTWTSVTATLNGASISDTPTASIVYNVVGDNTVNCTAGNSQIILVYPNPTLTAVTNKTLVCKGGPSTMTAGGAHTYSWDPGAGSVLTATALVNPLVTTMYTVTGSYTTTCFTEKTISVTVFSPTMTVTQPTNTCDGGTMTLTASGANAGSYNWNTGGGFTNQFQTIVVSPTALTVYSVSALSSSNAVTCPLTQTTSVGIFYNPTITAVAERTTICRGETGNLIGSGGVNYSWSNAMTGKTITVGPYTSPTTLNFTVTGTDANNCSSTGTVVLKISGCTGISEVSGIDTHISVYPNPNNGEFIIHGQEEINLTLVNELGQIVRTISLTHTNNYEASVKDLTKGIYFVTGQKDKVQIHQKVIVTK